MKTLADKLREQLGAPDKTEKAKKKTKPKTVESAIMDALLTYDNSGNKSMVHVRFDEKTVRLMNQFKMATQIDVTKLVSFSVKHLFESCPELKTIIKQFIQNTDL